MGRRARTSLLEDVLEILAGLPWWVCVVLAIVSFLLLGGVASQPIAASAAPGAQAGLVAQMVWRSFATVGQFVVPLVCLVAAVLSAVGRRKRQGLVADVAQARAADALHGMSWREFEMLVGEAFRLQGYQVVESGGGGPDGGVDLVLSRPGRNGSEKFLVQCKQWRAYKVGVDVVRELYGVMAARGATGGFVVTSGRFTQEATDFAEGRNVRLIDGDRLHGLIRQVRAAREQRASGTAAKRGPTAPPQAASTTDSSGQGAQPVLCPRCAKPMALRTAKRGPQAGSQFWGCTDYPACRGTRDAD